MRRLEKYLSTLFLLSLTIALACGSFSICEAKGPDYYFAPDETDYYFGSDGTNYLDPDNMVTVNFNSDGDATILTRLHAKAYYPAGVGDLIEVPVSYPPERVIVKEVSVSNSAQAVYKVIGARNQTIIQVIVQESPREVYVEVLYAVKGVSDESGYNFRLLLSSFTTEISVNLMIDSRETWISRKSVELTPSSSRDTYFLVNEEVLPFAMYIVLSNVNSRMIEFSLGTQAAPYSLEMIPYYALTVSIAPTVFALVITNIIKVISKRRRVGLVVLAYRNLRRRLGRFLLTILGVSIPAMLLVQILVQGTLAQKMLGPKTSMMEWYIALILIITMIIGGFQVFNTISSSVLERMSELGVMKAIGFNPSFIFKMVTLESALIGLIAGLLGGLLAAILATISAQVFYGLSLSNTAYAEIVASSFGSVALENPFLRNYVIAAALVIIVGGTLADRWPPEYEVHSSFFMASSLILYLMLLRPTDPFTIDRLIEIAPALATDILTGVLFAVILSTSAGSYVAYKAGRIEPTEAMRRV